MSKFIQVSKNIDLIGDADLTVYQKTLNSYLGEEYAVGVFENRTCFFSGTDENRYAQANKIINELKNTHLDFSVREMTDGNFIVTFSDLIFSLVFREHYLKVRYQIIEELSPEHDSQYRDTKKIVDADNKYIGILARSRLIEDLESKNIILFFADEMEVFKEIG